MNRNALEKLVFELQKENETLREENTYLKFELEELKSKRYKPNKKDPLDDTIASPSSHPKERRSLRPYRLVP